MLDENEVIRLIENLKETLSKQTKDKNKEYLKAQIEILEQILL